MKLNPTDDRVIVAVLNAESKSPGGIVIPDVAKEKSQRGKIVAVGPGRWQDDAAKRLPMTIAVGEIVLFNQYAGVDIEQDGQSLKIMRESDIIATLTE